MQKFVKVRGKEEYVLNPRLEQLPDGTLRLKAPASAKERSSKRSLAPKKPRLHLLPPIDPRSS
jgi:hypothetical protein